MKYEMLYLIDSSIAEDAREALIAKFEGLVASLGGKVLSTDKWGVRNWLTLSITRATLSTF